MPMGKANLFGDVDVAIRGTRSSAMKAHIDVEFENNPRTSTDPRISCVVPCLNEQENLPLLVPQLIDELKPLTTRWQIVLIDDGSTDRTLAIMRELAQHDQIQCIQFTRNFGKEAAISAGLEAAICCDAVVVMDSDGQHPASVVPRLVAKWREGADVVSAVGKARQSDSWVRRLAVSGFYTLINVGSPTRIDPNTGDFRLLDQAAVNAIVRMPERTRFMKGLYSWIGFSPEFVAFETPQRRHGNSKYSWFSLVRLSIDALATFSSWPLFAIAAIGTSISLVSFLYGTSLILQFLAFGNAVSGWTTLAVALFLSTGLQLIGIGVLGVYLAKVFDEVKQRPLFISKRHSSKKSSTYPVPRAMNDGSV